MLSEYVEDTWRVSPRLEVRGGVRFESTNGFNESQGRAGIYKFTNGVIDTSPTVGSSGLTDNKAKLLPEPRIGIAWNVFGNGKLSVNGGFGLHHSLLDNLDYRFDQAAPYNTTYAYKNTTVANPTSGAAGLISPSTVQTDMATPTVLAYNLRVQQQLEKSTSITLAYVGSHAYNQILSADLNEPAATVTNGRIYYPTVNKLNPAAANTTSWISQGIANYNALEVDLQHSYSHGLQVRANYTWSKNLDNGSAWNTSVSANTPAFVSYPADRSLDYGRGASDIRHLFALNGSYELPFGAKKLWLANAGAVTDRIVGGWTLSSIVNAQTGFPFSPQLGYNPTGSGDTRNPVRPDINPNFHGALYASGTTAQRVAQFYDPTAFSAPAYGTVGNLGRDTLAGPRYVNVDLSLGKTTQITERVRAQFRAEFFNALNHTNLQTPNPVVFSSGPTQGTTANQTTAVAQSPTAGVITSAATSRQIQLGVKLIF
jgi:hypothetical protein